LGAVLLRPSSPAPSFGGSSHLCAKCEQMTPGIPVGGLCASCWSVVRRKAARIARWVAIGTTLPLAVYVTFALPREPTSRLLGLVAVLIWYVLTFLISRRVALVWLQ